MKSEDAAATAEDYRIHLYKRSCTRDSLTNTRTLDARVQLMHTHHDVECG